MYNVFTFVSLPYSILISFLLWNKQFWETLTYLKNNKFKCLFVIIWLVVLNLMWTLSMAYSLKFYLIVYLIWCWILFCVINFRNFNIFKRVNYDYDFSYFDWFFLIIYVHSQWLIASYIIYVILNILITYNVLLLLTSLVWYWFLFYFKWFYGTF